MWSEKAIFQHPSNSEVSYIQVVRNVLDQIKELSYFFNYSEPRQKILDEY